MEIFKIITLSLSGLLLVFVGSMRLLNPIKTYLKNSGITLPNEIDLLNEVCGVSAVQLFAGIIILLGIPLASLIPSSFVVASLIFLGFAFGRIFSIAKDGKPNKQLMQGIIFELVFGAANLACLILMQLS